MPSLYKIGYTERKPFLRAKEISTTGVPHGFTVEYSHYFENAVQAEQEIHNKLKAYRVNRDLEKAIEIIKSLDLSGSKSFSLSEYKENEIIRVERYKLEKIEKKKKAEDRGKQLDTWKVQRDIKEREKERRYDEKLNHMRRRSAYIDRFHSYWMVVAFIIALPITYHCFGYKIRGLEDFFVGIICLSYIIASCSKTVGYFVADSIFKSKNIRMVNP